MKQTKATKTAKSLVALVAMLVACVFCVTIATPKTVANAEAWRSYQLPSKGLPTGVPDFDEKGNPGLLYTYTLQSGFYNYYGYGLYSGTLEDADGKDPTIDIAADYFRVGTGSGDFAAGRIATIYAFMKLPKELVGLTTASVKARFSYDYEVSSEKTTNASMQVTMGSYGIEPNNSETAPVKGATAKIVQGTGNGKTDSGSETTNWTDVNTSFKYLVINMKVEGFENIEEGGFLGIGKTKKCQTSFTAKNFVVELFVEADGNAPTITPWYPNYSTASNGAYVRAADGVNFIPYTSGLEGARYNLNYNNLQALEEEYYNESNGFGGYANNYSAHYHNFNGKVLCHNYINNPKDDGKTNMFLSQQRIASKTISFIVYDYFSGIKSLKVIAPDGHSYDIYPDEENSFSWGDVYATSFAYLNASRTGETFRGIAVKMDVVDVGQYRIEVSDNFDLSSDISVNIGGMDMDSPEIPNMEIVGAIENPRISKTFVANTDNKINVVWQLTEAEEASQTAVAYSYKILREEGGVWTEIVPTTVLDASRYITVRGETPRPFSISDITNGTYRIVISCVDEAGNVGVWNDGFSDLTERTFEFVADNVMPSLDIALTTGTSTSYLGAWTKNNVKASYSVSEEPGSGLTYFYRIGSEGEEKTSASSKVTFNQDMDDVVYFWVKTGSGLVSNIVSHTIRRDSTEPELPPVATGLLKYASEIVFSGGTVGTANPDAAKYIYPWDIVPYMSLDGETDVSSPYVFDYKFYYQVSAYVGGSLNGGGNEHVVTYSEATTFKLDLFDDGVSGDRLYGKKVVKMWVVDQAGNASEAVLYTIETVEPRIVVSFEKTGESADKFYDGTATVVSDFANIVLKPEGMSIKAYLALADADFDDGDTFAADFVCLFKDVNAAENIQIVVTEIQKRSDCNKYISYYKLVDEAGNELTEASNVEIADFVATINPVRLSVSGFALKERQYDGSTTAIVESKGTIVSLDSTLDESAVQKLVYNYDAASIVYDNKNAGLKRVLVTGMTLTTKDPSDSAMLANFTFIEQMEVTGRILPKKLTLSEFALANNSKVYDGTTAVNAADINVLLSAGVLSGETVEIDYSAVLKNANVCYDDFGNIIPNLLTVSVKGLKGADAANYSLAQETKTFDFVVNPKEVSVTRINIGSKVYDGTNKLTDEDGNRLSVEVIVEGTVGTLDKINITVTYDISLSSFASADVGVWEIQVNGIKLATKAAATSTGNYVLKAGDETYVTEAAILPRVLNVKVSADSRKYNGTTMAENPVVTYKNVVAGEEVFVGKPVDAFTNLVSAKTDSGKTVDLYSVSYGNAAAAVSSYVNFVFGGYKHVSECTDAADLVAKRYTLTFVADANGTYMLDDATSHYRLITASDAPAERFIIDTIADAPATAADAYVVWHMIYNADGTENKNYCFSVDGEKVIGLSAPAPIERASATAELVGFYTYDESGNPYLAADGVSKDYIKQLFYGSKTAVLESGREVKVNRFGYDVSYYCDEIVIAGVTQPRVTINTTTHPSLNTATIVEPQYDRIGVGTAQIGMKNAIVNNYDFDTYIPIEFEVIPAPLTVNIADATEKFKNQIRLSNISVKVYGLQNNEQITNVLGKKPMAALLVDGEVKEGLNGKINTEIAPGKYDIVVNLVAEEGFSLENYYVKDIEGYVVEKVSGGFIVRKTNAFTVIKNIFTGYEFTTNGRYVFKDTTEFYPLRITSLPDGVTVEDLKIYVYTGDGINWTLKDAYSYKYTYDMTSGVWSRKGVEGTDGKGVRDAGNYKIVYELTDMVNYEDIVLEGYLTIEKKTVEVNLPISSYEKVYDGYSVNLWDLKTSDDSPLLITVNGINMGEINTQYSKDAKFSELIRQSEVKNAGNYYCRIYYPGNENVKAAYSDTLVITIRPKAVNIVIGETKFNYYDYFTEDGDPVELYDEDEEYIGDALFEGVTFDFVEGTDEKIIQTLENKIKVYYLEDIIKSGKVVNEWRVVDWTSEENQERIRNSQQDGQKSSWNYRIACEDSNYQILASANLTGIMEIGVKTVYSVDEDGGAMDNYYYYVKMENNKGVSKSSKLVFSEIEKLTPADILDEDDYDLDDPDDRALYVADLEEFEQRFNIWYNLLSKPLDNNKTNLKVDANGSVTIMKVFTISFFNNGTEVKKLDEVSPVGVSFSAFEWNDKDPKISTVDYSYTADGKIVVGAEVRVALSKLKLVRISGGLVSEIPYDLTYDETSETYVLTFNTDTLGEDCFYALVATNAASINESTRYIIVAIACAVGGFAIILAVVLIVSAKAKAKAVEALGRPIDAKGQKKADKKKRKEEKKAEKAEEAESEDDESEGGDKADDEKPQEKAEEKKEEQPKPETPAAAEKPQAAPSTAPAAPAAKPAAPAAKPAAPAAKPAAPTAKPAAPTARPAAPTARPAAPAARPAAPTARPATPPMARPQPPKPVQPPKPEEKK